jgi:hypothetical protein
MNVPLWVTELADAFWQAAGMQEPFPRALRRPIARALTMMVVSVPRLRLHDVRDWLVRNNLGYPCALKNRALRACLVARRGWGYVFLDGADAEEEQRFSLAHELAHFLRHYWQPRQEAVRRFGAGVLEVFDGDRPPAAEERIQALLATVPIGFHLHLMQREEDGACSTPDVALAEDEADWLACELLAPGEEILLRAGPVSGKEGQAVLVCLLRHTFGLPADQAQRYSKRLLPTEESDPLLRRLGLA